MDSHIITELCYVLKTIPFKERDLIAILFSETRGKFTGIARNGVQSRRFGGSLDLFVASDFSIDTKTIRISEATSGTGDEKLVQILSATARHTPTLLSKSFEKLSAASCLNEILIKGLPSHKPAAEIFKLYSNCIFALEEMDANRAIAIVNAFILKFTQWLGLQPSLTRCLACEKTLGEVKGEGVFVQVSQGSWLCTDCVHDRKGKYLSKTLMFDAYQSLLNPIRKTNFEADPKEHEVLLEFLEQHLIYYVPGFDKQPLTSSRFLKSPEFL